MDWAARQQGLQPTGDVPGSKSRNRPPKEEEDDDVQEREKLTNWRYRNVSEALKGSKQTNQRAELTAILRALDIAPRHREVTIYTDSKYAIDCVTNWYRNWQKNGWVNSKGKPVENKDLVVDIREKIEERETLSKATYFVWVKGHKDNAGNIAADRLAVQGAIKGKGLHDDDGRARAGDDAAREGTDAGDVEEDEAAAAFKAMESAMQEDSDEEFK